MNNSSHFRKSCALFAGLLLALGTVSAGAAEYMTPEFAKVEFRPKTMVLIPPRAEVTKKKVTSSEQMIEEAAILEEATSLVLREHLGALGYTIRVLTIDEVNTDPKLQLMVRNFNDRYDADLVQVVRKPKDIRKRRFSFGDEARILATYLEAEAIIVARISASGATGGQKTMAFLVGGSSGHAALNLSIVAGDNGDLEGFFTYIDQGMSPEKIALEPVETMAKVSEKALKDFPAIDEFAKLRKSWPQDTDRQVPDTAQSDEEVFSDLEALFGEEADEVIPDEEMPVGEMPDVEMPNEEMPDDETAEATAEPPVN
jgi:hypothetical protein